MGKQTKKPYSGKSGAGIWEDEPVGDGSIANERKGASAPSHNGLNNLVYKHGSVRVLDEMKLEREAKHPSEIVDRRGNEAQSVSNACRW